MDIQLHGRAPTGERCRHADQRVAISRDARSCLLLLDCILPGSEPGRYPHKQLAFPGRFRDPRPALRAVLYRDRTLNRRIGAGQFETRKST